MKNTFIKKGENLTNAERVLLLKNLTTYKDIKESKIRICFYGRVSTEHESQLSALKAQMQWYDDQLLYHKNWVLYDKYIDEGITGTQAKKRPRFLKMIEDAKQGKFDLIVTREVCRFARNTVQSLQIVQELKQIGVEVYFVSDNIWSFDSDSELRLSIMSSLAQEESRKTSERAKAGQYISRKNGVLYGNGNILGYKRLKDKKTYIIDEEQAETVRRIYDLYLEGNGYFKICRILEEEHRKCSNDEVAWDVSKISRILSNTTYKGIITYGQSMSNNYLEQERITIHDKSMHEQKEVKIPIIIEPAVWDRVAKIRDSKQVEMKKSEQGAKNKGIKVAKDLWTRKIVCACGASMRKDKWRVSKGGEEHYGYYCYGQIRKGSVKRREALGVSTEGACAISKIADWKIDMIAKMTIEQVWTDRNAAVIKAYEIIMECYTDGVEDNMEEIERLNNKIKKKKKIISNLILMLAAEDITREEYYEQKEPLDAELSRLNEKLVELEMRNGSGKQKTVDVENELNKLKKVFKKTIDFSKPILPDVIVDYFIRRIIVTANQRFEVDLNFDGSVSEEGKGIKEVDRNALFDYSVDFNTATKYKKSRQGMLRNTQWTDDIEVMVYMIFKKS